MPKPTLVALPYSPWSEKARWALDHHHVGYREVNYVPMLGEPWLRIASRKFTGRVSVPVLITPHGSVHDSLRIARHAERVGTGSPLFPAEHEAAIESWNARSEAILAAARVAVIDRTSRLPAAQLEALPGFLPAPMRAAMRPLALVGSAFLVRKYGAGREQLDAADHAMREGLDALRDALAGGRRYLLGDAFTFADLAMAVTVQCVRPPAGYLAIGEPMREAWTDAALCERYPDLLAWRDRVYADHRAQ